MLHYRNCADTDKTVVDLDIPSPIAEGLIVAPASWGVSCLAEASGPIACVVSVKEPILLHAAAFFKLQQLSSPQQNDAVT